jgi:hypothetical protein
LTDLVPLENTMSVVTCGDVIVPIVLSEIISGVSRSSCDVQDGEGPVYEAACPQLFQELAGITEADYPNLRHGCSTSGGSGWPTSSSLRSKAR